MIEDQSLNYIIASKDVNFMESFGEIYYDQYLDEYKFVRDHYRQYKVIPDIETVQQKFPEFQQIKVSESKGYLGDALYDRMLYRFFVNNVYTKKNNKLTETIIKSATKGRNDLLAALQALKKPMVSYGVNIVADSHTRYDHLMEKLAKPDEFRFSTGLPELDMSLGGLYRGEELFVIFARTNNGKTWIAEKLAVSVWAQGYNVGFFSPEMTADSVGYRFDTLFKNFDNQGIQGNNQNYDTTKYKNYIDALAKNNTVFSVTTLLDFNKNATVSALRQWVIDLDLKMLVIDGLSYLTNERATGRQTEREQLTDLSEDLLTLSNELKIPVIVVIQANRSSARDKDGEVSKNAPELDTIFGADGVAHNATRVVSVVKNKDMITLYIPKNRYGLAGQKLVWQFNINVGKFTYVDNPKSGLSIDPNAPSVREEYNDKEENYF